MMRECHQLSQIKNTRLALHLFLFIFLERGRDNLLRSRVAGYFIFMFYVVKVFPSTTDPTVHFFMSVYLWHCITTSYNNAILPPSDFEV